MAEATATRPSRARTATKAAAPAKAAPAKAEPAAAAVETPQRIKVELEYAGDTKNFARFNAPDSLKGVLVGSLYAPLGTARVGVVVFGKDDAGE